MPSLRQAWSAYIDNQHREPRGPVGRLIGARMRRQHTPETDWCIELLQIAPGDRVLELGFGAGRGLALALARAAHGRVVGLDRSPTMLRAAARTNRAALRKRRLTLLRGDLAALPFAGMPFDRIFSLHTFYFWPDRRAVATQLADMLRPGGRMLSVFATARTLPDGSREIWPLQGQAEELAAALSARPRLRATLADGPDSRQFNNVALVVERG